MITSIPDVRDAAVNGCDKTNREAEKVMEIIPVYVRGHCNIYSINHDFTGHHSGTFTQFTTAENGQEAASVPFQPGSESVWIWARPQPNTIDS